jgi:hypothetical protein
MAENRISETVAVRGGACPNHWALAFRFADLLRASVHVGELIVLVYVEVT